MIINNKEFDLENKTYIMGILNVTPDSFSDGGRYNNVDAALKHVEEMIQDGANIIDVGGESTRPGFVSISEAKELDRICDVIKSIRERFDIPISIDTYKPQVAKEAVNLGAGMINDIRGLHKFGANDEDNDSVFDEMFKESEMAKVIAETGVACCLMHNHENDNYSSFLYEIISDLDDSVNIAKNAGIKKEQIILDPGFGFRKNFEQNIHLMKNIDAMGMMGFPILIGTSRKSFIGKALDLPVEERLEGSLATTAYAFMKIHVGMFRVHDVKEHVRIIKMLEAIKNAEKL